MPHQVYVLLTWTTFARMPNIDGAVADFLRAFLPRTARRHGARVIEMGIVSTHVHVLIKLPPVIDMPRFAQSLKGASAYSVNRKLPMGEKRLQWARGYDVRSVSPRALKRAIRYLRDQPMKHPLDAIVDEKDRSASTSAEATVKG